jgi:hypothetical protein
MGGVELVALNHGDAETQRIAEKKGTTDEHRQEGMNADKDIRAPRIKSGAGSAARPESYLRSSAFICGFILLCEPLCLCGFPS